MRRFIEIIVTAAVAMSALTGSAVARDLRSPDAKDAARSAAKIDLRSPDARAATGVPTFEPGDTSTPQIVQLHTDDFEWGDAGIGAAAMLGLVAVGGGTVLFITSRRRERRLPPAIG